MALALGEQGDQDVGPAHLVAAGGLDVDGGALHDALEPGRGLGIARTIGGKAGQVLLKELPEIGPQLVEVDAAGPQHRRGVGIVRQPQEQMLERRILVVAIAGERQGAMQRLFEVP